MSLKKHILTVMMAAVMICSYCTAFSAEMEFDVTESLVKIEFDLGPYFAGREIGVTVINPNKSAPLSDSAVNTDAFAYVGQTTLDVDGKAEISYVPTGGSGYYEVSNPYSGESARFAYIKQADVDSLFQAIKDSTDYNDVADLFTVIENPADPHYDDIPGYVLLGLDEGVAYDILKAADPDAKESIYKRLLLEADSLTSPQELKGAFLSVAVSEGLFSIQSTNTLKTYIGNHADEIGLTSSDVYNNIYKSTRLCGDAIKTKVLTAIIDYTWDDESKADIVGTCEEIMLLTTLYNTTSYDLIGEIIYKAETLLETKQADIIDKLDVVTAKTDVYRKVAGIKYSDVATFVSALNYAIDNPGNGGGGGGGGGSSSSSTKEVNVSKELDTIAPPTAVLSRFKDLGSAAWAVDAIEYLAGKDIVSGKTASEFYPQSHMTREEFAKVLVLAFDLADDNAQASFADVSSDAWYYQYVASANKKGIINGYGDNFGTGDPITRQDIATIACRALEALGKDLKETRKYEGFEDEGQISDYAVESVKKLYNANILNGIDDKTFNPKGYATRAQVAKIFYEILVRLEG